jgi:hypothetical protein
MGVIGAKPRPRVLCWGISSDSQLAEDIVKLAPTVTFLISRSNFRSIRQREWDAAIFLDSPPEDVTVAPHLKVIQFGGAATGTFPLKDSWAFEVRIADNSVATEFLIPDSVPPDVRRLIQSSLVPLVQSRSSHPVMMENPIIRTAGPPPAALIDPFLTDGDGKPLAGRIVIAGSREWWWLPKSLSDKPAWIVAAFAEWSQENRDTFPQTPVWVNRPEWQTS